MSAGLEHARPRPPWTLWRHILVEVCNRTLLGLGAASLVLVLGGLLQNLTRLLEVGVGLSSILQITAIAIPSYLSYAVPAALLFGVVTAFGTLAEDGEIVAILAGGISVQRLLPPVLLLGLLATGLAGWIVLDLEPTAKGRTRALYISLIASDEVLTPGRVRPAGPQLVYVAERGDATCPLRGVLISEPDHAEGPIYIHARCATLASQPGDELRPRVQLAQGSIHFGGTDPDRYRKLDFQRLGLTLDLSSLEGSERRLGSISVSELFEVLGHLRRGEDSGLPRAPTLAQTESEIHRRASFPLASLLLAMLGVALASRAQNGGRSGGVLSALVLLGIYQTMTTVGFALGDGGYVEPALALWLPNLLVLVSAVGLLRYSSRGYTT